MSSYLDYLNEEFEKGEITLSEKKEGYHEYEKADYHKKRKLDKDHASINSNEPEITKPEDNILKTESVRSKEVPKVKINKTNRQRATDSKGGFLKVLGSILYVIGILLKYGVNIIRGIMIVFVFFARRR
jgi:hypothetical protein